jgi:hypothetical protein
LNKIVNFLGVGFALYSVAVVYEMFNQGGDPIIKHMVKCKYCRKRISVKVMHFPYSPNALVLFSVLSLFSFPSTFLKAVRRK